ncbi:MAG TPA: hypothetical protein VE890_05320 [Thermoguttaceae bacterium]|nr:hypothetical protein [Thermoguttaceae bacterium]
MMQIKKLPQAVTRHLDYYVYLYIHPETDEVFYVGKGRGNRALAHANGEGNTPHDKVIRDLKKRRLEPRVEILIHGLEDENTALAVEMAAIDLLGLENLANSIHGHHSSRRGRMTLEQIRSLYHRKQVTITEPAILIRISRAYRYGMSPIELYDATRATWVIGNRRRKAEYALAVFEGIVREVYRIAQWLPSGSTLKSDQIHGDPAVGRWEFVGKVADDKVRSKYLNHWVAHYFAQHSQNPLQYVNC